MNFIISTATDIGTTKATNQDSFNARVVTTPLGRMAFAVVCDGMGGLDKGEVASASVVNAFCKWAEQRLPDLCESGLTDSAVRRTGWHRHRVQREDQAVRKAVRPCQWPWHHGDGTAPDGAAVLYHQRR